MPFKRKNVLFEQILTQIKKDMLCLDGEVKQMIDKMVQGLVRELETYNVINKEDKEIYLYGVEVFLNNILLMSSVIIVGVLVGQLKYTLLFVLCFPLIRSFTGGYHATKKWKCFVITHTIHLGIVFMWEWLKSSMSYYILLMFLFFSIAMVFCIDPIENKNNPKSIDTLYKHRYYGRWLMCILAIISLLGFCFIPMWQGIFFTLATIMFTAAFMMLVSYFENGGE